MIILTLYAAIILTILGLYRKSYMMYECPKETALILCAGLGAAWSVWVGLDVTPLPCQLALVYLLYACASITWTANKRIAIEGLLQKASFIFFFLVAYNARPPFDVLTVKVIALAVGLSAFWGFYRWFRPHPVMAKRYSKSRKAYGSMGNAWKAGAVYLPGLFVALHIMGSLSWGWEMIAVLVVAGLAFLGVLHSKSRSAYLGLLVACLYLVF